jgi:hypothetical protein
VETTQLVSHTCEVYIGSDNTEPYLEINAQLHVVAYQEGIWRRFADELDLPFDYGEGAVVHGQHLLGRLETVATELAQRYREGSLTYSARLDISVLSRNGVRSRVEVVEVAGQDLVEMLTAIAGIAAVARERGQEVIFEM